jgi:DNA-binding NarL/FixJ family response regulator
MGTATSHTSSTRSTTCSTGSRPSAKLIAEGHSSKEVADTLVISVKTVERHRANILQKLDLHDRLELTRYAIRAGLVEP